MKMRQYFPKPQKGFKETLVLKLICLIMRQNEISKIFYILIPQGLY